MECSSRGWQRAVEVTGAPKIQPPTHPRASRGLRSAGAGAEELAPPGLRGVALRLPIRYQTPQRLPELPGSQGSTVSTCTP